MTLKNLNIEKTWTLFLDRDGVINHRIEGDYVKRWDEFIFMPDVKESICQLNQVFGTIVVVTNQQGIGKGLYTESDLEGIHMNMMLDIILSGGQVDRVYYAPELASANSRLRKPNIGMAEKAKEDFPSIDFSKSLMIGDSYSDMEFGRRAGMKTVFLNPETVSEKNMMSIDFQFSSWKELMESFK